MASVSTGAAFFAAAAAGCAAVAWHVKQSHTSAPIMRSLAPVAPLRPSSPTSVTDKASVASDASSVALCTSPTPDDGDVCGWESDNNTKFNVLQPAAVGGIKGAVDEDGAAAAAACAVCTVAAHAGIDSDYETGDVTPALHLSSTFRRNADLSHMKGNYVYGYTPTVTSPPFTARLTHTALPAPPLPTDVLATLPAMPLRGVWLKWRVATTHLPLPLAWQLLLPFYKPRHSTFENGWPPPPPQPASR